MVRFADSLGLELQTVREYEQSGDDPPFVPESAIANLITMTTSTATLQESARIESEKRGRWQNGKACRLRLSFTQPSASLDFVTSVRDAGVRLENCRLTSDDEGHRHADGTVRVRNDSFEKNVFVRYTTDAWATSLDVDCEYVAPRGESLDGGITDRFRFSIRVPASVDTTSGRQLEFAVAFVSRSATMWDNNGGLNYSMQCYTVSVYDL